MLVWTYHSGAGHRLRRTSSNDEDSGKLDGFSIADAYSLGADVDNLSVDSGGNSLEIAVYGSLASVPATGRPVIYPSAEGAGVLLADTFGIDDRNGSTFVNTDGDGGVGLGFFDFSYQWFRIDPETDAETEIGADTHRYQPVDADIGQLIKVRVEFTDRDGNPESATSLPFGPIAEAGPALSYSSTLVSNTGQSDGPTGFNLHNDNSEPRGMWSDGATIWVANDGTNAGNKLFAYKLSDGSRDSGKDIAADISGGNLGMLGICSDGTTMWVADSDRHKVFAYKVSDQSRDSGKDFNLHADNARPRGVWCNASTIWIADDYMGFTDNDKLYAYKLSDGSRDSGKDFNTLVGAGNKHPRGIWSDGTTMWVADRDDDKIYAYKMSDKSRDADKDITLDSGNDAPYGMWSNGHVLLVVDSTDTELYAYELPGAQGTANITQQYAMGFRLGAHGQGYEHLERLDRTGRGPVRSDRLAVGRRPSCRIQHSRGIQAVRLCQPSRIQGRPERVHGAGRGVRVPERAVLDRAVGFRRLAVDQRDDVGR